MKKLNQRIETHGLFFKLFIVMVISIITVSILITISTIKMSERLFMETFSISNYKIIDQIKTSFENFSYGIVEAANDVKQSNTIKHFLTEADSDAISMNRSYYDMNVQMKKIYSKLDSLNLSMVVLGVNDRTYTTNYTYWPIRADELIQLPLTQNTYLEPKKLLYQYEANNTEPMIVASKALVDNEIDSVYGSLFFAIREKDFKQFYSNYTSIGNDVLIINKQGRVLSSNLEEVLGQYENELLMYAKNITDDGLDYINAHVMGKNHIVLAEYLPPFDMYIVNIIDKELLMKNLINKKAIMLIGLVIVSVALLLVFLMTRRLTKSLRYLVKQISDISKYDFNQYIKVDGSYETRQLSQAFNYMLDELHVYVEQLMITQKKQRNAELEALQQQINPHFLYNTLASIKIMVQQGNKEKAAEMINALISLLQNMIGNISETVTVEHEISNMKNYVLINQMRYGERIKVNYFISPDCLSYKIPKLIIQPFIENAFFHAFNKKLSGNIRILIAPIGDELICEIVDNGDGMILDKGYTLPKFTNKRKLHSGIGIKNVHERIKLLYGEKYGVEIASELSEGTKVKITLPIIDNEKSTRI